MIRSLKMEHSSNRAADDVASSFFESCSSVVSSWCALDSFSLSDSVVVLSCEDGRCFWDDMVLWGGWPVYVTKLAERAI